MTKLEKAMRESAPANMVRNLAKSIILPGKERLSVYELSRFFFKELSNNRLFENCAAVTYNFVMAMPPGLLVLFSLIPFFAPYFARGGEEEIRATILDTLKIVAHNKSLYDSISVVVIDFMDNAQGGVLSSGIFLTLFFASNGMMGLINSFERDHLSVYVKKSGLARRWTAIKLTVLLLVVAILSIVVIIIQSQSLNEWLLKHIDNNVWAVRVLSVLVVVMILFTTISLIYKFGPSLTQRVRFFSTGAIFATAMCVLTSAIFFFLVDNIINYNKIYGSIGSLMAFMVWIWLNVLVILIGYDLNVSVLMVKKSRQTNEVRK